MTVYPLEVVVPVGAECLLGLMGLLFLFSFNRENIPAGFRLWPTSSREWLIFYFHALEAFTLTGIWICSIGFGCYQAWGLPVMLTSYTLLLLSSFAVWRWDRGLCYYELLFCLIAFLLAGFALPVASGMEK